MFNFLYNIQESNILSNKNQDSKNKSSLKGNNPKEELNKPISLNTRNINPLLLQQYLINPIDVPQFMVKEEFDELKSQIYYQYVQQKC